MTPLQLATVERAPLKDQIYRQLRDRLMAGFFQPGQPMSTRSIAAAVDSSVMPVRDALRRLEAEHALVPGPNRTLMVPLLSATDLAEIRDIRMRLEGLAVERAAALIDDRALAAITGCCHDMDAAAAREPVATERYLRANWAFHSAIYAAAAMPRLAAMIESLWMRMGPHIRLAAANRDHVKAAMAAHWDLVEGLGRRDPLLARSALERDIGGAAKDLQEQLARAGSFPLPEGEEIQKQPYTGASDKSCRASAVLAGWRP